jgi:hypothetical protein
VEGRGCGLVWGTIPYLYGGTEENHEKISPCSQCPGRDLNQAPFEWKSEVLWLQPTFSLHSQSLSIDSNQAPPEYKSVALLLQPSCSTINTRESWTELMKSPIYWDVTLCSLLKVNWHFEWTCCLHLHGWRISQARNQGEAGGKQRSGFLLGLFFDPEYDMFLQNTGWLSMDYTMLYSRRQNSWDTTNIAKKVTTTS